MAVGDEAPGDDAWAALACARVTVCNGDAAAPDDDGTLIGGDTPGTPVREVAAGAPSSAFPLPPPETVDALVAMDDVSEKDVSAVASEFGDIGVLLLVLVLPPPVPVRTVRLFALLLAAPVDGVCAVAALLLLVLQLLLESGSMSPRTEVVELLPPPSLLAALARKTPLLVLPPSERDRMASSMFFSRKQMLLTWSLSAPSAVLVRPTKLSRREEAAAKIWRVGSFNNSTRKSSGSATLKKHPFRTT